MVFVQIQDMYRLLKKYVPDLPAATVLPTATEEELPQSDTTMSDAFTGPGLHVPPPPVGHVPDFVHGRREPTATNHPLSTDEAFSAAIQACGDKSIKPGETLSATLNVSVHNMT